MQLLDNIGHCIVPAKQGDSPGCAPGVQAAHPDTLKNFTVLWHRSAAGSPARSWPDMSLQQGKPATRYGPVLTCCQSSQAHENARESQSNLMQRCCPCLKPSLEGCGDGSDDHFLRMHASASVQAHPCCCPSVAGLIHALP